MVQGVRLRTNYYIYILCKRGARRTGIAGADHLDRSKAWTHSEEKHETVGWHTAPLVHHSLVHHHLHTKDSVSHQCTQHRWCFDLYFLQARSHPETNLDQQSSTPFPAINSCAWLNRGA